ncbi:hypothetical protein CR162_17000 [Pseudoroseomonas rhizosphaerae]|uniref:Uncharacterized protein n=1 Tax=Teichococcus rhizosphaerae TaxID=1335062 RepID=A0A2C7A9H6_9PROT|nr:hypothetical protein [Pseudoroseomonas rhizosphaerae]PHK93686.1 hypothetical protein CR162_17000 [Pseudoroseomonas rhizosphaerae]
MAFGLGLLLNAANQAMDRLWLQRVSHDVGLLLSDHPDPGLASPLEGPASAEARALRSHLLRIGAQMRAIGLAAMSRAILEGPFPEERKPVLLALLGSGPWEPLAGAPGQSGRPAGNGMFYRLECRAGGNAAHAPHAMREREQTLWLHTSPDAASPATLLARLEGGTACLSLDAALRDVLAALEAEGEATLAAAIRALRPCGGILAAAAPGRPQERQAPAAA